ncbi:MAG: hypothetical protein ACX930_00995 [Erythrobacter sp.]
MTETSGGRGEPVDPLVIQTEKIFAQRQARFNVIDADLLAEPGWDILLRVFIEMLKGRGCPADRLHSEIGALPEVTRRLIALLVEAQGNLLC